MDIPCNLNINHGDFYEIISFETTTLKWFINRNLLWISFPDQDTFDITKSIECAKICADQRNIKMIATNYSSEKQLRCYLDAGFVHTYPNDPTSRGLYWVLKDRQEVV